MYVIGVYDVNRKRVAKVMKAFRKRLNHVQRSVFEGDITKKDFEELKKEVAGLINEDEDYIIYYKFRARAYISKEEYGESVDIGDESYII